MKTHLKKLVDIIGAVSIVVIILSAVPTPAKAGDLVIQLDATYDPILDPGTLCFQVTVTNISALCPTCQRGSIVFSDVEVKDTIPADWSRITDGCVQDPGGSPFCTLSEDVTNQEQYSIEVQVPSSFQEEVCVNIISSVPPDTDADPQDDTDCIIVSERGLLERIFSDGFESGSFSAWSSP